MLKTINLSKKYNENYALKNLDLDECLITEDELDLGNWKMGYDDNWPVERVN